MNGLLPKNLFDVFMKDYQEIHDNFEKGTRNIACQTKSVVSLTAGNDGNIDVKVASVDNSLSATDVLFSSPEAAEKINLFRSRLEAFKQQLREVCLLHGANFEEKLAKIHARKKVFVGKLPQEIFDDFLTEYQAICEKFDSESLDFACNTMIKTTFKLGLTEDEEIVMEECNIEDEEFDVKEAKEACPEAKKVIDTFTTEMDNFKTRFKEACEQHSVDFDDKMEKIRERL